MLRLVSTGSLCSTAPSQQWNTSPKHGAATRVAGTIDICWLHQMRKSRCPGPSLNPAQHPTQVGWKDNSGSLIEIVKGIEASGLSNISSW